ncbi:MAG: V-type ATP synthase subunit E [Clostridia bacterium]|nr:V-type ATP synthase subunit E [Clostridia bacterium]
MATQTNGLNKITEKILSEARQSAKRILASAQEECDRIAADYDARISELRCANKRETEQKTADVSARSKSAAAMQARNIVGKKKSELVESVFHDAYESVRNRSEKDYTGLVVGLLVAALSELAETEKRNLALYGEEEETVTETYEVVLNGKDRETIGEAVIAGAKKKLKGVLTEEQMKKLVLAPETANIDGGVILRYGEVESNCSLEMLFSELRRELETDVGRVLFATDAD